MNTPQTPVRKSSGGKAQAVSLVILRVCVGTFVFFFGLNKAGWLLDAAPFADQLSGWLAASVPANRWFLERLVPGAPVFARIVPLASMAGGLALALGFWTRMAAALCLVTILSLQLADGSILRFGYLADANGLPLAGALLTLVIGGARLPFSVSA